ncbi:hypothetical protein D1AOALGA4SA_753 [Olavius algarvensis Delta 1 endosymbiont]|nr:hypothetical protein D1AOALGA4SA_753 [Olavius algarvensis Delta 1 endosymbiont]
MDKKEDEKLGRWEGEKKRRWKAEGAGNRHSAFGARLSAKNLGPGRRWKADIRK